MKPFLILLSSQAFGAGYSSVPLIQRNPVVRLAPCARFGRIEGDWLKGKATRIDGEEDTKRIVKLVNSSQSRGDRLLGFFEMKNRVAFSIKLDDER